MRSRVSLAWLALVFLVTCAPSGVSCGEPSKLESHPNQSTFIGAPLGPLLVRNFRDGATTAVIGEYTPGYATKVVVVAAKPFDKPLTLRGRRCSDGIALRFAWTYPFAFNSTPAPSAIFAAAGEDAPVIEPLTTLPVTGVMSPQSPPYFLFASSGKWLLEVSDGGNVVGRAVVLVP